MLYVYSVPPLARLLARQGDAERPRPWSPPRGGARCRRSRCSASPTRGSPTSSGPGSVVPGGAARIDGVIDVVRSRTRAPGAARCEGSSCAIWRGSVRRVDDAGEPTACCPATGPACAGTGRRPRRPGRRSATGTRRHSNWPSPGSPSRPAGPSGCSTNSARALPPDLVRERLRGLGVDRIPRGPQASTRANPVGLTARQARCPGPARRRFHQRPDRPAARALGAHRRQPRGGDLRQARRDLARCRGRASAGARALIDYLSSRRS